MLHIEDERGMALIELRLFGKRYPSYRSMYEITTTVLRTSHPIMTARITGRWRNTSVAELNLDWEESCH